MKLIPLLWLLCGLVLVVGDQDPPVASAPKAPIAGNVTVSTLGNATAAAAGATGSPIAAGSPADKAQANNQSPPTKATKIEQQTKEAEKTPAVPGNVAKNRKRTDTDNPKPAGNATVTVSTPKPVGVETKVSTAAAAATPAPAPAPSPKPKDNSPASPTAAKTATMNTAKPTAGSTIVSEGQSMKDVTKANNATSHQPGNNNKTIATATSTTATTKTTSKTTPKPTKPLVVYSMGTHTEWEQKQEQGKAGDKPPLPKPVSTQAEPGVPQVQELIDTQANRGDTSYVVPIVTVLLTVPLAIGVVTIMYRRFRYMWSTRHYRRMDFLVDGMYND